MAQAPQKRVQRARVNSRSKVVRGRSMTRVAQRILCVRAWANERISARRLPWPLSPTARSDFRRSVSRHRCRSRGMDRPIGPWVACQHAHQAHQIRGFSEIGKSSVAKEPLKLAGRPTVLVQLDHSPMFSPAFQNGFDTCYLRDVTFNVAVFVTPP